MLQENSLCNHTVHSHSLPISLNGANSQPAGRCQGRPRSYTDGFPTSTFISNGWDPRPFINICFLEADESGSETEDDSFALEDSAVSEQAQISIYHKGCETARKVKLFSQGKDRMGESIQQYSSLRSQLEKLKDVKVRVLK